jgi:putative transposase
MPRRLRDATGGLVYHVLNRATGRRTLFAKDEDYAAFERVLEELFERTKLRILSYSVMPNHWHLLVWPREDGELSEAMRWLTVTHAQRWHAQRHSAGTGPVYQGRFKSFPIESDEHFLTAARYVERNALRANLVDRAQDWRWSSLWRRLQKDKSLAKYLSAWPIERPRNWVRRVNQPLTEQELEALRRCVRRGQPFGGERWTERIAKKLGLESTLRPRGRPRLLPEESE